MVVPPPSPYQDASRLFQIGVNFQPVEVEKNVFAPVVEDMILKVG